MQEDCRATTYKLIVLLLAAIGIVLYLVSLELAYPVFQNTRLIDPLASIHSLFPIYYIAIAIAAASCVISFISRIGNRVIHLLLLLMLAVMLWYTPYNLAGFVYQPDAPWHAGVAVHMPQISSGEQISESWYAQIFPSSFIVHFSYMEISGIEPLNYISKIFPLISIFLFVLLCYVFISQLFNYRIAFLSLLLAVPGIHYIQLHPSPRSIGVLLMLTALVLLFKKGIASRACVFCLIIVIASSHVISPLILLVFLGAALVASFSTRIGITQAVLVSMIVVCFVSWLLWPSVLAQPDTRMYVQGEVANRQVARLSGVLSDELTTIKHFLLGTSFIYSNIDRLNKVIYILYAFAAAILTVRVLITTYLKQNNIYIWASKLGGLSRSQIFLVISAIVLLILTLLLAAWQHDLAERGLTFVILILSCIIASAGISLQSNKRLKSILLMSVMFLTLTFPVVAYSIDAYTSYPKSEEDGLEFLVYEAGLVDKTLVVVYDSGQLALYLPYPVKTMNPSKDSVTQADLVVFRNTGYYYLAMRVERSFDHNTFITYRDLVKNDDKYNQLYLNSTTEIYGLTETLHDS